MKEDKYVLKVRILDENGDCIRGFYAALGKDGIKEAGSPCNVASFFTREQAYKFGKSFTKASRKKGIDCEVKPMQINVAMRDYYNYGIKVGEKRGTVSDEVFEEFSQGYFR